MKKLFLLMCSLFAYEGLTAQCSPSDLIISGYIEGSGNNKCIQVYNGTGNTIDLSAGDYAVKFFYNGNSSAGATFDLTGTVGASDTYIFCNSSHTLPLTPDQTSGGGWFNGDDAIQLVKGTTVLDCFGQVGTDPGSQWGSGLCSTADNTIYKDLTSATCGPDANCGDAFDPSAWATGGCLASNELIPPVQLPVELIYFNTKEVSQNKVSLSWQTASEENNSHFEVEHSTNGRDFQTLDKVIGNGTTAEIQQYNYIHEEAANGKNYYRLRQVDFDGAFEYSDVAVVEIKGKGQVQIRPTLANENVTLAFGETTRQETQVQIIDIAGRKVMATSIASGTDQMDLSVATLEKGLYFVQLALNGELTTLKFVKQ